MRYFILLLACTLSFGSMAQSDDKVGPISKPEVADRTPEFVGGMDGLIGFFMENLVYPKECAEADIQGKVYVRLKIDETGKIAETEIVSSDHDLFEEETLRVIGLMPDWKPAVKNGEAVDGEVTLPITFQM